MSGVDPNCVFCAIAQGSGDASLLHEDDFVIAFMDIRPVYRFGFTFPPGYGREPERERLDEQAAMIRAAL